MSNKISMVCLDVGEKRIGVAIGDNQVKLAIPFRTIDVDGHEIESIDGIFRKESADILVVGYPRNQSGETTAQTKYVEDFTERLSEITSNIVFQDESLTSVIAEQRLASHNRPYAKADIDAQAAAIILQDYIEDNYV